MNQYNKVIYNKANTEYDTQLIKHLIEKYGIEGGKLLDVGCGNGKHMKLFELNGTRCYGVDIRIQRNEKIKQCDIENDKLPYRDKEFDYVFSKSLFEHILRADNALEECRRVLKPHGKIIIIVPEWESQMKHYWDDYTHLHAWTYKSLKDVLKIYHFKNVRCDIFYQLPFVWKRPYLKLIPKIISILPQRFKWKTREMRNGEDRKLIRFSKERMLIGYGEK